MNDENKRCHLEMIQGIITRMGKNSFQLKEWSVGIMIAIYAFAGQNANKAVIITIIPLTIFWMLDTYYLCLERKFRMLYDETRTKDNKDIDYSMDFNSVKIKVGEVKKICFFSTAFSKSTFPFYLATITTTLIIYFIKF